MPKKRVKIDDKPKNKSEPKENVKLTKAQKQLFEEMDVKLDGDFVNELCIDIYKYDLAKADLMSIRNGKLPHERMIEKYEKKYGSKERAEKRFNTFAQIYAPNVRLFITALAKRGLAPKGSLKK